MTDDMTNGETEFDRFRRWMYQDVQRVWDTFARIRRDIDTVTLHIAKIEQRLTKLEAPLTDPERPAWEDMTE